MLASTAGVIGGRSAKCLDTTADRLGQLWVDSDSMAHFAKEWNVGQKGETRRKRDVDEGIKAIKAQDEHRLLPSSFSFLWTTRPVSDRQLCGLYWWHQTTSLDAVDLRSPTTASDLAGEGFDSALKFSYHHCRHRYVILQIINIEKCSSTCD